MAARQRHGFSLSDVTGELSQASADYPDEFVRISFMS
jgi:hypothetical protein